MPNRQDLIKECRDYGFSIKEISDYLNIEEYLVKSALVIYPPSRTEIPAMSTSTTYYPQYAHSTDKTIEFYEVLYEHGPGKLNRLIKKWGPKSTSEFLGIRWNVLHSLKIHFGYEDPLPANALELCLYFPEEIRREVDIRDYLKCARCDRETDENNRRYHKIYHPGSITAENCITLCKYCRTSRINKLLKFDPKIFNGMTNTDFKVWVKEYAPFVKRNRIYPKGQIGTWNK
jgi:DNA-binding transcriptional MerR regulator